MNFRYTTRHLTSYCNPCTRFSFTNKPVDDNVCARATVCNAILIPPALDCNQIITSAYVTVLNANVVRRIRINPIGIWRIKRSKDRHFLNCNMAAIHRMDCPKWRIQQG
ncbi:hypothetical protein V8G54_020412 [Vigna mungo]|uniref:Uncharacterized protein n=1 Tax=Vigna mungo TaxID=3915 RepID=A0AAQ3RWN7_VIGMU